MKNKALCPKPVDGFDADGILKDIETPSEIGKLAKVNDWSNDVDHFFDQP